MPQSTSNVVRRGFVAARTLATRVSHHGALAAGAAPPKAAGSPPRSGLVLSGGDATALTLAGSDAGSRVVHSLIQVTINNVTLPFPVFSMGTFILMAFALRQVLRVPG